MSTRRTFIKSAALASIAYPYFTSSRLFCQEHQSNKKLRVALMGLGGYASRVAEAMQNCDHAVITGLISGTPAKLISWGEKYNVPESSRYNYENYHDIKDNDQIDAVYVITPNALHAEHTIGAAKAGKHVICEKPMSINAAEGRRMVETCKEEGVELMIGYRLHFEANTLEVIRMREEGEMGEIKFFQGQSGFRIGNPDQWRLSKALAGGGAMMDIGIYSINGARYMVGEEPIWVTAQETKTDPKKFKEGVDETITFQLGFPSGVVASCLSSYNIRFLDRFFLSGTKNFAELWPATGYGPLKAKTQDGDLGIPHVTHQQVQMDEMAKIILNGAKPKVPVDGVEGWKDMVIIDAIYEAVRTGDKIPLDLTY